jgi:hypothetical protein
MNGRDIFLLVAIIAVIALVFGIIYVASLPSPVGYGHDPTLLQGCWSVFRK